MAAKLQMKIVAVGKVREAFWRDATAEYSTRLTGQTTKFGIVEVADEPTPDSSSAAQEEAIRTREGERILAQIGPREYVIALDRNGRSFDSVQFAAHLEQIASSGAASALCFVIGGSLGLSQAVLSRADLTLSFGAFTFPHQMMRVILLEQLFRAGKINRGESYHK